ncbi:Uncharacterised protein [Klebsiella pneumoniae]|nr:Uncharacterised protein [Klebsiella pneumoniae]
MLITTHTPFLISDSKPEKVLVFSKDKYSGAVTISIPKYNTLGASINKITMNTFGKRETIGGHAQAVLGNDSNLLIVFYVQIMPDDLVMQLHRF